jgi:rhamnogalacturonan endolyase
MENLDRGLIAVKENNGKVFVGWRVFGIDPEGIAFNLY